MPPEAQARPGDEPLPLAVLIGPTASGKSALAIELAELLAARGQPAEVVNADSMLVYRGMDIGTAKPTPAELARVPHHLVDIMDVTQTASVAEYQTMARQVIAELRSTGVLPILVGGSSLYIRAIVDRFDFPGTDPAIRRKWQAELDRIGAPALHRVLAERHPLAAAGILPGNGRRIVRALEVIELTGDFSPQLPQHSHALANVRQVGLQLDRGQMDTRLASRVDRMWQAGLVDEVRPWSPAGCGRDARRPGPRLPAGSGLPRRRDHRGTGQAVHHRGTRRFARKQLGWFARDPRIRWLPAGSPTQRPLSRPAWTLTGQRCETESVEALNFAKATAR